MIHGKGGYPGTGAGQVAGFAGIAGGYMGCAFTTGHGVVMTTKTGANDLGMIHRRRRYGRPGQRCRLMAGFAGVSGINMSGGFTSGNSAVMATETTAI